MQRYPQDRPRDRGLPRDLGGQDRQWGSQAGGRFEPGAGADLFRPGMSEPIVSRDEARRRRTPRNYTRPDERIKDEICERLYHRHDLDLRDVSVSVREGMVTLDGAVRERWMKHAIEDLADDCMGVRDVENRVRVRPAGDDDAEDHRSLGDRIRDTVASAADISGGPPSTA